MLLLASAFPHVINSQVVQDVGVTQLHILSPHGFKTGMTSSSTTAEWAGCRYKELKICHYFAVYPKCMKRGKYAAKGDIQLHLDDKSDGRVLS